MGDPGLGTILGTSIIVYEKQGAHDVVEPGEVLKTTPKDNISVFRR